MKLALLIGIVLLLAGCLDNPKHKTLQELQAEMTATQQQIELAAMSGGRPVYQLSEVCIKGVVYYRTLSYGGSDHFTIAISKDTRMPQRCTE